MNALRVLVYAIMGIQFLLSMLEGSSFHKYVKLFGYLLILYMCCSFVFSFFGQSEQWLTDSSRQYELIEYWWQDWEE